MEKVIEQIALDEEWVLLIKTAKNLGISLDEIRQFLKNTANQANESFFYYDE